MNKKYVDPLFRDAVLGDVIDWSTKKGVMLSLEEMTSFDPLYSDNYKENWNNFVSSYFQSKQESF
jgi:hypothetical protein